MVAKSNVYEPTTAERKLLEVLVNPEHRNKSITAICELADVSRKHYYDVFRKEEFVTLVKSTGIGLVNQSILEVIKSYIEEATTGSHQHGKVLLEMADLHRDAMDVNQRNSGMVGVIDKDTTAEDAAKIYAQMVKGSE